jgi:hypothetical protein
MLIRFIKASVNYQIVLQFSTHDLEVETKIPNITQK